MNFLIFLEHFIKNIKITKFTIKLIKKSTICIILSLSSTSISNFDIKLNYCFNSFKHTVLYQQTIINTLTQKSTTINSFRRDIF